MTIQISAFRWVPPFAQGYVKDLRVRWVLEEAGLSYDVVLIDPQIQASPAYRTWQPFGQVPAYREDGLELFESGAIVLHVAMKSNMLVPESNAGRARVTGWVVAALNTVEPCVQEFIRASGIISNDPSHLDRVKQSEVKLEERLAALEAWLDGKTHFIDNRFTAGDLMMTTVLRELSDSGILRRFPRVDSYCKQCESRPAFSRALEAQLRAFRENAPA